MSDEDILPSKAGEGKSAAYNETNDSSAHHDKENVDSEAKLEGNTAQAHPNGKAK